MIAPKYILRVFDSGRMCRRAHTAPQYEKTRKLSLGVFNRVAGPGIEPGSGGSVLH